MSFQKLFVNQNKKDESGIIPNSSHRSVAAGYFCDTVDIMGQLIFHKGFFFSIF